MDRDYWINLILDPQVQKCFAGETIPTFTHGDRVEVLVGADAGKVLTVVYVGGNAFTDSKQVFVDHPSGQPTWYYPWNLRLTPE